MAYYNVGRFIRKLRKDRGLSQEELAHGIVENYVLSKIESGKQMPRKATFDALIERLGLSAEKYSVFFLDDEEFQIYEKRDELNRFLRTRRIEAAVRLIDEMEKSDDFKEGVHLQFLLSAKASVAWYKSEDSLVITDLLYRAIKITIPDFKESEIENYMLTRTEIEMINMTAIEYAHNNEIDKAIEILYKLKKSIDNSYVDEYEKATNLQLVLYNLSKYLGLARRYEEAVEICDIAKKILIDNNKLQYLAKIICNKAYCLAEMGDTESCRELIYQAYYGCGMVEKYVDQQTIKEYAKKKLNMKFKELSKNNSAENLHNML